MKRKILSFLSLMYSICIISQTVTPEPFKYYQIVNSENLAFGRVDNVAKQCVPDAEAEGQAFEFIPVQGEEGVYMIRSAVDNAYVCKVTVEWDWDWWSIVFQEELPTVISKAKYSIEQIAGTDYVGIKNLHAGTYWGADDLVEDGGIFCDKPLNEKAYWKLVELPTPPLKVYEKANARLDAMIGTLDEYPGIQSDVTDFQMEMADKVSVAGDDDEHPIYLEAAQEIGEFISKVETGLTQVKDMINLFDECTAIFESQDLYPGLSDLEKAYEYADGIYYSEDSGVDEFISAYDSLKSSIRSYYDSQIPFATEENPADMTYMIKSPNFRVPYAYSPDCALSSEGWVSENTGLPGEGNCFYPVHKPASEVGKDVTCYNSWTWQFSHMNLYQDVEGLPDGWYRVECLGWTDEASIYKQHAYAVSMSDSVMSNMASTAMTSWETFRTASIPVYDGKLRIGFQSESGGGSIGWFLVTDFRLRYCGALSEETLRPILDKSLADGRAMADTMMFAADKKMLMDSISKYEAVEGAANLKQAIMSMKDAMSEAYKSVDKQNSVMAGIYKALEDSVDMEVYSGDYYDMASRFLSCMEDEINSADASYVEMDSLEGILYAFRDRYVPTLYAARELTVEDAFAKGILDDNINRQVSDFTTIKQLPEETLVDKYVNELEKAMAQCEAADLILAGGKDFTGLIVNPEINNSSNSVKPKGWDGTVVNGDNRFTGNGQQVDGNAQGYYLDSWNATPGTLLYNMHQTIESVPNGVYRLTAMTRTTSDKGVYLYAFADNDSSTVTLSQVELEKMNITELGGPSAADGGDSIATVTDTYGSIFAEVYKRTNGGQTATDAENDTLMANNGWGSGWHYTSLDIEVKNHILTIGFTCDSTFTQKYGGTAFAGTWISADNFRLVQLSSGDNEGWNPAAGISSVPDEDFSVAVEEGRIIAPEGSRAYSVSGMPVNIGAVVPDGVYIVKFGKNTVKVVVNRKF